MLKIFTLKFEEKSESFNDSILSNFLADKEVNRWESEFFERKNESFWTILIEYRSLSHDETPQKTQKNKDESYKELLSENDWPLFKVLREWRGELSKKEGIPPYIVFKNIQLANLAVMRPFSLNGLQEIEGIGKAKTEKYGKDVLQIISLYGQPVSNNSEEDANE